MEDREIYLKREFDAPRELVFEAWTKPGHISLWWGPDGSATTEKMNFKAGSEWIFTMHGHHLLTPFAFPLPPKASLWGKGDF